MQKIQSTKSQSQAPKSNDRINKRSLFTDIKNIKKIKNTQKNNSKISKNSEIIKDFINWVEGIQEDEPIRIEANNVYFIVEFLQNDIVLSYSADERQFDVFDYGAYFPLEAEYFDCPMLKELARNMFDKKLVSKAYVKNLLFQVVLTCSKKIVFFKNKTIFFGERFSKVIEKVK